MPSTILNLKPVSGMFECSRRKLQTLQETFERAPTEGRPSELVDYSNDFEWSALLRDKLHSIFKLPNFHTIQEQVCNASMAGTCSVL
ncbi:hypothetical protein QCA50_003442 [Cerrena zonata]|uniref:Uncharacterized protein n=1 Tax=Cerrena zonata TaxID=2478898 RepID=A0AAW0GPW1_9APHY